MSRDHQSQAHSLAKPSGRVHQAWKSRLLPETNHRNQVIPVFSLGAWKLLYPSSRTDFCALFLSHDEICYQIMTGNAYPLLTAHRDYHVHVRVRTTSGILYHLCRCFILLQSITGDVITSKLLLILWYADDCHMCQCSMMAAWSTNFTPHFGSGRSSYIQ